MGVSHSLSRSSHGGTMMIRLWHAAMIAAMLLAWVGRTAWCADDVPAYVGGDACAGCHVEQANAWKKSHHALAMQPATAATVLGDFSGAQFERFGSTTACRPGTGDCATKAAARRKVATTT